MILLILEDIQQNFVELVYRVSIPRSVQKHGTSAKSSSSLDNIKVMQVH